MTRPHFLSRRRKIFSFSCLILIFFTWFGGLVWFTAKIPTTEGTSRNQTDAIVVLTGGAGRLEEGFKLLDAEKLAGRLFVSGAARGVDVKALLKVAKRKPTNLKCCIAIGYDADNTIGNAYETSRWMRANHLRSLRLVTSNYHMIRSLEVFERILPEVSIVSHPVLPKVFNIESWWLNFDAAQIVFSEYNKYLITLLLFLAPQGAKE